MCCSKMTPPSRPSPQPTHHLSPLPSLPLSPLPPCICKHAKAIAMGGKSQFPYLVDPNTDTSMYESDDIINYLFDKYGS